MDTNSKIRQKKITILIIIFTFFVFIMRFFTLSSDLPNWGIGNYQSPDEGPYAYLALNQLNYGQINPDTINDTNINQFTAPHLRGNLLGNTIIFLSMKIFGDNYVGFRISSLITMLLNTILIFLILNVYGKKKTLAQSSHKNILIMLICSSLLIDFTFSLASKVVETTVYRMFCVLICIYIYTRYEESKKLRFFFLGLISVFSVCGIYITNIFLVLAIGITTLFYCSKNIRKHFQSLIYFIVGGTVSYLLCELYYRKIWNVTILQNTLDTLNNFSSIEEYTQNGSIYSLFRRVLLFISSNYNTYNIAIFFVFLLVIPIIVCECIKKKEEFLILNICIYGFLFLQTLYSEDYIIRKYIMVAPSLLFLCFHALIFATEYQKKFTSKKAKICLSIYTLICSSICCFILYYRFYRYSDGSVLDYSDLDKIILWKTSSFCILFLFISTCLYFFKNNKNILKVVCGGIILNVLTSNIYLCSNYLFFNKTYTDKKVMEKLVSYQKPKGKTYILGDYMLSYNLYNSIIPVVNNYDQMFKDMISNKWYLLGYSAEWNEAFGNYMKQELNKYGYTYEIIEEFPREQKTFGVQRNLSLYKAVKIKSK